MALCIQVLERKKKISLHKHKHLEMNVQRSSGNYPSLAMKLNRIGCQNAYILPSEIWIIYNMKEQKKMVKS